MFSIFHFTTNDLRTSHSYVLNKCFTGSPPDSRSRINAWYDLFESGDVRVIKRMRAGHYHIFFLLLLYLPKKTSFAHDPAPVYKKVGNINSYIKLSSTVITLIYQASSHLFRYLDKPFPSWAYFRRNESNKWVLKWGCQGQICSCIFRYLQIYGWIPPVWRM